MAYFRVAPTRGRQVTLRVSRIKLLDVEVLHVWTNIGEAPRDTIAVPDNYARQASRSHACYSDTGTAKMDHVPNRRRSRRKVWIIGEQRLAANRVLAAD